MKAESTVRKEITKLQKIIDSKSSTVSQQKEAYVMAETLRWLLYDRCGWTPAKIVLECY